MIQRIQSVYLALVAILFLSIIFIPAGTFSNKETKVVFSALKSVKGSKGEIVSYNYLLVLLAAAITAVAAFTVLQYHNRKLQIKLCGLTMLLIAGFLVAEYFMQENLFSQLGLDKKEYSAGSFLPLIAIVLVFLAQNGIKKDDNLVKSADRLR